MKLLDNYVFTFLIQSSLREQDHSELHISLVFAAQ